MEDSIVEANMWEQLYQEHQATWSFTNTTTQIASSRRGEAAPRSEPLLE
jgi:hypothetical protein